jgi:hypothetical protein
MPTRKIIRLETWDIPLYVPEEVFPIFPMEKYKYETFPVNYCGEGNGFSEKIIPDYIFGLSRILRVFGLDVSIKISPACFIHDYDYEYCSATWEEFYEANTRLHENIETIIEHRARNEVVRDIARYRAVTYRNAVDLQGKNVFWSLKAEQGHYIPDNAVKHVNHEIRLIYRERINGRK